VSLNGKCRLIIRSKVSAIRRIVPYVTLVLCGIGRFTDRK